MLFHCKKNTNKQPIPSENPKQKKLRKIKPEPNFSHRETTKLDIANLSVFTAKRTLEGKRREQVNLNEMQK